MRGPRTDATKAAAKAAFIESFGQSFNFSQAAVAAGIHRCTADRWLAADEEFAERLNDVCEKHTDLVDQTAFEMATSGEHPTMTQFVLKARRPKIYGDRSRMELTGANGGPIVVAEVPLDAERAEAVAAILKSTGAAG
jgi:hypothetical protein